MPSAAAAKKALRRFANKEKALFLQRFFKCGPGEYAEGDKLLGVNVPKTRDVAREFAELPLNHVAILLDSPYHEDRLLGLIILVEQYRKHEKSRAAIFRFYLAHRRAINNWDLVDVSAPSVVGAHLERRPRTKLFALAKSKNLWDRRIAIVSTQWFINRGDPTTTLALAEMLLNDNEDLIHKATGWMLREVGKRCAPGTLERFLDEHATRMPRTMLRYAIEKFPERTRRRYLVQSRTS